MYILLLAQEQVPQEDSNTTLLVLLFAAFLAIATGAWVLLDVVFNRKTNAETRLESMKQRAMGKLDGDLSSHATQSRKGIFDLLEAASPALSEPLKPKNEKEANKLIQKLSYAGFRDEKAPAMFTSMKMISAIFGFVIGGGASLLTNGVNMYSLVYTIICGGTFMFLPEIVLSLMAKSRKEKIFLGLPDALDLMVVCVEAGLGMDQAMRKVAEELSEAHPTIGGEFKLCNQQLQYGWTRTKVLEELGDRNGVEDLQTLSSILIQVDKFGTSVGTALRTQSEAMRTRRRQIAEEKAAKTAVKLIFPLVMFIFPGIFVVLVGPAAITMINEMLPAFQK